MVAPVLGVSCWFTGQKRCRWRYSGVVPGVMGIAAFSPPLDEEGNVFAVKKWWHRSLSNSAITCLGLIMMNTEGNNGNKPLGLWTSFPSALGQWWGRGSSRCWGGCVANGSLDLGRLCFWRYCGMFSGYAFARLGAGYPSNGGISTYFVAD